MPEPEDTPGPWRASWSTEGQSWLILNENGHMIANAFESETNARRIAAAPDLLEALAMAKDWLSSRRAIPDEIHDQIDAAIAKARGKK